jgi:cell division protein ZapA
MARNRVKLTIGGSDFVLSSDESTEYMEALGRSVDGEMKKLMEENPRMSMNMAAVLTAINNADRARKAEASSDHLRTQVTEYLEENKALRAEMEALRRLYS